jgi:hypothetical protein
VKEWRVKKRPKGVQQINRPCERSSQHLSKDWVIERNLNEAQLDGQASGRVMGNQGGIKEMA